ncbi:MAG: GNAT family N-acetyltransferase [Actinobacteria bacterium]|nr:GNAT family N-acetyltransferase [Actinomycetota bacterium]
MPSPLVVRPAAEPDFDLIGELCVDSYATAGHLDPSDPYTVTLRDARARDAQAKVLVAERDGAIVGTVTICPSGTTFAEVGRDGESEFRFLAVAPTAWRTGVGEALVAACEQWARENGAPAHVICVIDRNHGAHKFYEQLGFTRLPERDWSPREGVNLLAFRRAVPYA